MKNTFGLRSLLAAAVALPLLASSPAQNTSAPPTSAPAPKFVPVFIVGADISSVQAAEDRGATYTDNGVQKDILQILKDHGFNYIRLRVFVDPTRAGEKYRAYSPDGYCDLPHTVKFAKRVKAANMGLLVDFHYSDSWADGDKQYAPAAWKDLPFPDLVRKAHDWTRDAVQAFKDAGATPDMVQVGNEIAIGMMIDGGGTPDSGGSSKHFDRLPQLLKAGISGVTDVDPAIAIMLHIDKGGDNAFTRWWVDSALANGVKFDILGQSCYTRWQGPPDTWRANFADLVTRYPQLRFTIVEIGDHVRACNDIMRDLPDGKGMGTFVWEPTQNGNQQGLFTSAPRRRGTTAPATAPATTKPGTVIPEKMRIYDDIARDYGLGH